MCKIIGLVTAWGAEDWIKPCLKQAKKICDEVLVVIAPHSRSMDKFADDTFINAREFIKDNPDIKNVAIPSEWWHWDNVLKNHSTAKATLLNYMLEHSGNFSVGNWIWTFDVDEFYNNVTMEIVRGIVNDSSHKITQILFEEKFFYIDMRHYLKGNHHRIFRICEENMSRDKRFIPTQRWYNSVGAYIAKIPEEFGMFHYSMLQNPWAKEEFWKTEYEGTTQDKKVIWLNKIYRGYDLKNEEYWITENEKLFGIRSPWFANDFIPKTDGSLFIYTGQHPDVIEELYMPTEGDFRVKYGFTDERKTIDSN